MTERKHSHYYRECPYENIDVYRIIDIFEITCPAAQHILKKVIATGKRGHKDLKRDWEDIVDSAKRKVEMLEEDARVASLSAFNASPEELGKNAVEGIPPPTLNDFIKPIAEMSQAYADHVKANKPWYPNTPHLYWHEVHDGKKPNLPDNELVDVLYEYERKEGCWEPCPEPVSFWWNSDLDERIVAYAQPEDRYA